jgi:hypothetical protein
VAKPKLVGITYARLAAPVKTAWEATLKEGKADEKQLARAKLRSLTTLESRIRANVLTAGDPVAHDRWPRCLAADYGRGMPNLFRFELADRWRGYYALIGAPGGGVNVWILYLWDHETYSKQSGYAKK